MKSKEVHSAIERCLENKDVQKIAYINRIILNIIEMQEIINNPEIGEKRK